MIKVLPEIDRRSLYEQNWRIYKLCTCHLQHLVFGRLKLQKSAKIKTVIPSNVDQEDR